MEDISEAEKQEFQHFINIIYSYMTYKRDGSVDVERIYRSFDLLSKDDKELLKESPARRTFQILQALMLNQQFISLMLSSIVDVDEGQNSRPIESNNYTESMEDILKRLRYIVKNSSFCRIPQEVEDPEIQPTTDPVVLQRNMNWVRTTLRQFVRDWSEEGAQERNQCFEPLLDALKRRVPIVDKSKRPKVLCPGSGLGRLPFEVLNLGYASQGNEFSYFMLIGSFFIINHSIKPKSLKIYPYCLDTSNRMTFKDQLQPVAIPDVSPADSNFEGHDFSMCAGEFTEVYENIHEEFDAVLTSFFLDTAKNVITYVRTIAKITKKGGLWANIGPLLYHYADISHNSIELPWDELESIISKWFKIENLCWKDANYTSNPSSMMKTQYKCVYFEAIRSDVESLNHVFNIGNFLLKAYTLATAANAYILTQKWVNQSLISPKIGNHILNDDVKFSSGSNSVLRAHKFRYVKVTLEKDTPDIGKQGEIVAVNRSFAFNYLVPFGFARYTTRAELVGQALEKDYKEALTNVRRSAALQLKNKIGNNCVLNFEVLAKEKGSQALNIPLRPINIIEKLKERRVFTPLDMLREQDVEINTNSGFITKFGTYSASLTLDEEIKASVKIVVSEAPLDCSFIPY